MMTRKMERVCECGNPATKYVYPLPELTDAWQGAMKCGDCARVAIAELKRLGHFVNADNHYTIEKAKGGEQDV